MKKIITLSIIIILILTNVLIAATINIPADYSTIQAGINAATNGDVVLVQPGTYVENLNYNGKNITVASLFFTTQDTSYISSTIIDGNQDRVVLFNSGETEFAILEGFKITNGDASDPNYLDYGGGGIKCINSNPTLRNLIIIDNTGMYGAGLSIINSNLTLDNIIIKGNDTLGQLCYGGGINISGSNIIIRNSIITGNDGDEGGGGINCSNSSLILNNVIISNNIVIGYGGSIQSFESVIYLINTTISNNIAYDGGGIHCCNYGENSNLNIINSILWNNTPQEIYISEYGNPNTITISYSDIDGGQSGIITNSNGTVNWLNGNIDENPLFVDPANSNYHLTENSPCIGAGDHDTDISDYEKDLDGNYRIRDALIDMGAYEYQSGGITIQNTIAENNTDVIEFTDAGTELQFTGTHVETIINATKYNSDPCIVGSLPTGVEHISIDRYWNMYSTEGDVGNYNVTFDLSGVSGIQNFNTLHILKRNNSSSEWEDVVSNLGLTLTYNNPYITVNNLTAFSDFGIGGGSDNTLPVELQSFTSVYSTNESGNEFISVNWSTATETDVQGFNIYRSENDEFSIVGNHINSSLILGAGTTTEPQYYSFVDDIANPYKSYYYWLESVDFGGISEYYGPVKYVPGDSDGDQQVDLYSTTELYNSYPNPAKNKTTIKYQLKGSVIEQNAVISIYNIRGELVKKVEGTKGRAEIDVSDLSTGIYLYQLKTDDYNSVKRMIIR